MKPKHGVDQLTTAELVRERSRLEAALNRPFADSVKALLQARLDAVRAEQDARKREADATPVKAQRAAQAAARTASP
jgi:hypothetical protein